jgi:hypothetical protein
VGGPVHRLTSKESFRNLSSPQPTLPLRYRQSGFGYRSGRPCSRGFLHVLFLMLCARSGRLLGTLRDRMLNGEHARKRQRDSYESHPHLFLLFVGQNWLAMTDAEKNFSRQRARYRALFGRTATHTFGVDRSDQGQAVATRQVDFGSRYSFVSE